MPLVEEQKELLLKISRMKMPFGRYKDRLLVDLPEHYLVWFARQGLPPGELGQMLGFLLELKTNGLEYLVKNLAKSSSHP